MDNGKTRKYKKICKAVTVDGATYKRVQELSKYFDASIKSVVNQAVNEYYEHVLENETKPLKQKANGFLKYMEV